MTPFSQRVADGLKRRGLTLREFCRAVRIDPSFFSKVLAGKRSPPVEEDVLRRIAVTLDLNAAELIVSAGRIPAEWAGIENNRELFDRVHAAATGAERPTPRSLPPRGGGASGVIGKSVDAVTAGKKRQGGNLDRLSARTILPKRPGLSEELL